MVMLTYLMQMNDIVLTRSSAPGLTTKNSRIDMQTHAGSSSSRP